MNILGTKITVPPVPSTIVTRERLLERLDRALQRRLTFVSAPAGSGKTTLLSSWIISRRRKMRAAWLSLGMKENQSDRFWPYIVAALNLLAEKPLLNWLQDCTQPETNDLEELINWVDTQMEHDFVLILDDYQFITSPQIHTALSYLLDYLPAKMHIVIASRSQPSLPVAQMRVRGQYLELTGDHLKFTDGEAGSYLSRMAVKNLLPQEIEELNTHAEGWAAGLQIAALSLREADHHASQDFLKSFAGSHYIFSTYFLEQVLCQQDAKVSEFLLFTSILDRFNAPLCRAVTGLSDGIKILGQLERRNLFLVNLDDQREWYRYHHLFGEFLENKLRREHAEKLPVLHKNAAKWFEEQGWIETAVEHALKAGDISLADRLIQQVEEQLWGRNDIKTLSRWFEALPAEYINSRPDLCLSIAWMIALNGNSEELLSYLVRMSDFCKSQEHKQEGSPASNTPTQWRYSIEYFLAHISILRGYYAFIHGQLNQAKSCLADALRLIPNDENCRERALAYLYMGQCYSWELKLEDASESYRVAARVSFNCGHHLVHSASLLNLAAINIMLGNFAIADEHIEQASQHANEIDSEFLAAANRSIRNEMNLARNLLLEAEKNLERDSQIVAQGSTFDQIYSHIQIARLRQAQERWEDAQNHLRKAYQISTRRGMPILEELVKTWQARFWITTGNLVAASHWANQVKTSNQQLPSLNELQGITLARLMLAEGKTNEATQLINSLLIKAREQRRFGIEIELLALLSLANHKSGQKELARQTLSELIRLTREPGYIRVFVDEGNEMKWLLQDTLRWNSRLLNEESVKKHVEEVLKAFGKTGPGQRSREEAKKSIEPLIEPLSDRELQVLQLIALGKSYEEVAQELVVALSTVQWHVKNIYQKLNVHSGAEAASVARELQILS